jgi:Vacuolar sorting protein 9 (VPS9) domain
VMDDEKYLDEQQQMEELQKEQHEYIRLLHKKSNEKNDILRQCKASTEADTPIPLSPLKNEKSFSKINTVIQENLVVHFVNQTKHRRSRKNDDDGKSLKLANDQAQNVGEANRTVASSMEPNINSVKGNEKNDGINKLNVAAVAGGIAGGIAGMIIAGPAGAYAGVMAASYLVEGTVVLVVVAAGVATGSMTGQHIEQQIKNGGVLEISPRRILRIGSTTSDNSDDNRKILLVRPHIQIDALWENTIMVEAKQNARLGRRTFSATIASTLTKMPLGMFRSSSFPNHLCSKDLDILESSNDELSINDKVILLVNRTLNDTGSVPGYVYRFLLDAFEDRCRTRLAILESFNSVQELSPRALRDDAHAVIKHVTATLLEEPVWNEYNVVLLQRQENAINCVRSEQLTELTASAVEALVFGVLYHPVYEEITQNESYELDCALQRKVKDLFVDLTSSSVISTFKARCDETDTLIAYANDGWRGLGGIEDELSRLRTRLLISTSALDALENLPQAHSSSEKLHFCVRFLEYISEEYARALTSTLDGLSLSADSLLKMVCQHIIILHLLSIKENEKCLLSGELSIERKARPELNAQIVFLEEFARDEQLLRGREGYALVTLQASLHFLNSSSVDELKQEMFEDIMTCGAIIEDTLLLGCDSIHDQELDEQFSS